MATSASKSKPSARPSFAHTAALPPPYQLAIEDTPFTMTVLEDRVSRDRDDDCALAPPAWFSVTLAASTKKRYLYLIQKETATGLIVLIMLFDRSALGDGGDGGDGTQGLRLPPSGAWMRAIVDGAVYVVASALVLTRKAITAWIGGHEPPTTPAMPPYT
jgi:hypothetical protein